MWTRTALIIVFFSFLSEARAQFFTPGMMMGQQCPYPYQMAPQIITPQVAEEEELRRDRLDRREARDEARVIGSEIEKLRRKIAEARRGLRQRLDDGPYNIVLSHMENRGEGEGIVRCDDIGRRPLPARPVAPIVPVCDETLATSDPACHAKLTADCKRYVEPPPAVIKQEPALTPPGTATEEEHPILPPKKKDDSPQGSIVPAYCSRMPASEDDGDRLGIVRPNKDNPPADTATTRQSGGFAEGDPRPPEEVVDCFPGDLWDRYREGHGRVRASICTENHRGVQNPRGNPDRCVDAIDRLDDLYEQLADLRRERDEELRDTEGGRGIFRRPRETGLQRFMRQLQGMSRAYRNRGIRPVPSYGYPWAPGSSYANMNYGAPGFNGLGGLYNGLYGFAPGGIPNGGMCNQGLNQNMFGNPYLQALQPNWMTNGAGPWGFGGPQIRPVPTWPGQGGPRIRPVPNMPGMPGVPGLAPGAPQVLPLAGNGVGGVGGAPRVIGGSGGIGGVGVPGVGGMAPNVAPLFGGTYGGQMATMANWTGNWGGGAVPSYIGGGVGGYAGPGYTYQPNYFNFPSLLGGGGGAPKVAPLGPY